MDNNSERLISDEIAKIVYYPRWVTRNPDYKHSPIMEMLNGEGLIVRKWTNRKRGLFDAVLELLRSDNSGWVITDKSNIHRTYRRENNP